MDYSDVSNQEQHKRHKSKLKKAKTSTGVLILRIFAILFIIGLFAGCGAGFGMYMGVIDSSPELNLIDIQPEAYTSIIYEDSTGKEIDRLHGDENREYVKLRQIPKYLQNAAVAIEDERFYTHNGIDLKGIFRAVYSNIKNHSLSEGASTITQQILKNNLFKDNSKKFRRKLQEQYLAVKYESQLSERLGSKRAAKDQILETYLNTIALNHGLNGVQAAAMRYFDKDVSELTLAESAVIIAITKNPVKLTPINHPESNRERQLLILNKMLELNFISEREFNEAKNEDVYSKVKTVADVRAEEESLHSYFVDQIITEIADDLQVKKSMSQTQAYNLIYSGGLKIYATIDTQIQSIVDASYKDDSLFPPKSYSLRVIYYLSTEDKTTKEQSHFSRETIVSSTDEIEPFIERVKEELVSENDIIVAESRQEIPQPQSAMVIMDFKTGQVKAIAGGRGEKLGNRTFDRATQAKRQPGSVFKVLAAYAPALDSGKMTPATPILDEYYKVGNKVINNYDNIYLGSTTMRTAIRKSINVAAVRTLVETTTIDTAFDYLLNFGFTTLIDKQNKNGQSDRVPALALGGITDGVLPIEIAGAFSAIANEGQYIEPVFYTRVVDHSDNVILENIPEPRQVLQKTSAFILTDMMKDVVTSGTGQLARFKELNMPIAGKTGTTTDDYDLLFAGYTPYYCASIWLGNDKPSKLTYDKSYHLLLWSDIMEKVHIAKNLEYKDFEEPEGVERRSVCMISGKLPISGLCDRSSIISEYFVAGTEPTEMCNSHEVIRICTVSNMMATQHCPYDSIISSVRRRGASIYLGQDENGEPIYMKSGYCNIHVPVAQEETPEYSENTNNDSEETITDDSQAEPNNPVIDDPIIIIEDDEAIIINEIDDGVSDLPLIIDSFESPTE